MALLSITRGEAEVIAHAARSYYSTDFDKTSLEQLIDLYLKSFFGRTLSRKVIFENLKRLRALPEDVSRITATKLERDNFIVVVSESPLKALPTPLGLCALYAFGRPDLSDTLLLTVVKALERETETKLRLTLKTFVQAPLTLRETAAVVFLLYNDSTGPSRGKYPQSVELRKSIDRIVQAFIHASPSAKETPHTDGAPGRWYLGEAGRKLGNAIHIDRGVAFVRPDHLRQVERALSVFVRNESKGVIEQRLAAFEEAFRREAPVLARNRVLFATRESRARTHGVLAA